MTATLPMLRWSSARSCARMAVYESQGAPARERTAREDGYLQRGKELGRGYLMRLVASERAAGRDASIWVDSGPAYWVVPEYRAVSREEATHIAELRVPWAYGVGHPDIWIPETGTLVEVLSSATASEEYRREKLVQVVGYAEAHPEAENVALVVVSPSDYTEDRTVVVASSRLYAELLDDVEAVMQTLGRWEQTGETPARVCGKPSEAFGHFCPFAEHCFADGPQWEPPTPEVMEADEDLIAAVTAFDRAKAARARLGGEDKQLEAEQKAAQAIIERAELPPGMDVQVGPYVIKRTAVQRKPSFQVDKAEAAGLFEPGLYGPEFWKAGAAYSTYRTELVGDRPQEDFGDVPWTDADLVADGGLHS